MMMRVGLKSDSIYTDDEDGQTEVDADVENEALSPPAFVKSEKGQKASAKKTNKPKLGTQLKNINSLTLWNRRSR